MSFEEEHGLGDKHKAKALKRKLSPQEREDKATQSMLRRAKEKRRGVKMTRSILG